LALESNTTWKLVVLALVIGLLGGILGAALIAPLVDITGPQGPIGEQGLHGVQGPQGPEGSQGPQGDTGSQGVQGSQGPTGSQGVPRVNGTDAVLQILRVRNVTQADVSGFSLMQWFNMSTFDSSMKLTINVQANSRIFAEFSSTVYLTSPGSIWVRLVVDNVSNSSVVKCSSLAPASGIFNMPGHIEFLTDNLSAGQHTVEVQFLRENGSPAILDRTLTVMEIAAP